MILIIGSAFQGKTEFAKAILLPSDRLICHYEKIIRSQAIDGLDPVGELHALLRKNDRFGSTSGEAEDVSRLILVADEVGRGIVPLDPGERRLRDVIGRTLVEAAKEAAEVYRVTCGIGERIK